MSRDIADRCVGRSLTLLAGPGGALGSSGGSATGLVVAAAVELEASDESVAGEDAEVVVSGDDEYPLACELAAYTDEETAPDDFPGGSDGVEAASAGSGERTAGDG